MRQYNILFTLKPAVRLDPKFGDRIDFTFMEPQGKRRIVISKIEETVSGQNIQSGLQFRVFLQAKNIREAEIEANMFADGIVSFITLISGIGLGAPQKKLAYDITPQIKERDFVQIFHLPFKFPISRRNLNVKVLTCLIRKIIESGLKTRERIGRSIQWYRMGSSALHFSDRFMCFWIGLESLNPLLQEKFSIKATTTISGISTFIQKKIPDGKKIYKKLRKIRVSLIHSLKPLFTLQEEVNEYTAILAEILFRAICYVSEVESWYEIPYQRILYQEPLRIRLEAILIGEDPNSLGPHGGDPYFVPKQEFIPKLTDRGITFEGITSFKSAVLPSDLETIF